jgi:hypothetical protein
VEHISSDVAAKQQLRSCIIACLLVLAVPSAQALAAPAARNTSGGISLSPFLQQISVQSSDVNKTFTLTLTNHTDALQELDLKTQDFGSLNDTGGILLAGSKSSYSQKYGLASWLSLETDTVVLQPKESHSLTVTVNNRQDLQPGGHYGAVAATVNSLNDQSGNRVVINQQLLSLVLVDKVGGEHYDLKLASMTPNGNWFHFPTVVKLRFQNPGNVHVIPRGLVKLKSPSGRVVAQGIINSESAFILPETFRELYVPLSKVGSAYPLPGLYSIEVDYRYDQINRYAVKQYKLQFIDLGLYMVFAVLMLLVYMFRSRLIKIIKKTVKKLHKKVESKK